MPKKYGSTEARARRNKKRGGSFTSIPYYVVEYPNFKTGKTVRTVRMSKQRAEEMAAAIRREGGKAKVIAVGRS